MAIDKQRIISLEIKQLKGIRGLKLEFGPNNIMGIFGANCAGKSTILHALACMYRPEIEKMGVNYKFSQFFKRDRFQSWIGSQLKMRYGTCPNRGDNEVIRPPYKIHKKGNRWNRDYGLRPPRDVFYIGVDSCIPQIEKEKPGATTVNLEPAEIAIEKSEEILQCMCAIFNRNYEGIFQHKKLAKDNRYSAVKYANGADHFSYTSLCMGAGEQRVLHILQALYKLPRNGLLLIDEIDLTIHTPALISLIQILKREAMRKNLQIVFTSHREELMNIEGIDIRFIQNLSTGDTQCYNDINSSCLDMLRANPTRPLQIYVEDDFARALTEEVLIENGMRAKATVQTFGAASNAFTLMAGKMLEGSLTENMIALTDGDEICTDVQREEKVKRVLTGTEPDRSTQRQEVLNHILQFTLPVGMNPEQYVHSVLKASDRDNEIVNTAKSIHAVLDKHSFVNKIIENLGETIAVGLRAVMIEYRKVNTIEWEKHVKPLKDWLDAHKNV